MIRSLVHRLLILLLLAWLSPAPLLVGVSVHAQEVDRELVDQADEDETDDEDEEEDGDGFQELLYVRRALTEKLREHENAIKETKRRIALIDSLTSLAKKADDLEERIATAEEAGNDAQVKELVEIFERLQREIDARDELMRYEYELVEVEEMISGAEREEDEERLEILERVHHGLVRIRTLSAQLLPIQLDGPESAAQPLEKEKAETFTNQVEKGFRALQILEEIYEAEEEEDEALLEELEAKYNELRKHIDSDSGGAEQDEKPKAVVDELLPVVVNEETLAPFANANLQHDVAPLLEQYCFDCHGDDSSSGELNLQKLLAESPIVRNRDQWINVIEQSKNHVMPPEDGIQPSMEERERIVLSLHNAIYKFDYSDIHDPGFEPVRRLTHREYSNTVRDLFGLSIDVVDRFPDDLTASSGFDNSANSLFIQPLLMERYVGIAEYVVESALPENLKNTEQRTVRSRVFTHVPDNELDVASAAKNLLKRFIARAFRRPATPTEVARYAGQVEAAVANGQTFHSAVKATLQTVLISPKFLLLTEESQPNNPQPFAINQWELASRLSYFLWASMPDDELFQLARDNRLSDDSVLESQVRRMLADPKASTLGSVFIAQWLGSQNLGTRTRLDPIDNPWCTETLMAAMREETSMFFNHLVRENRPITELVDADYTFLNEELAKLYRIRGVKGEEMRKVDLNTDRRGGIFGQGSLLAVTAFPGRTSPVVRGKWILDNVLGTPPPPPPPNVSELSEELEERRRLSFREKLELHREKPNCYACHSQMDPLGFSLERFDWFGRYRTRRGRGRIDARGTLPNGTEFDGLAGLKKVIIEQRKDDLVRQVSQKLLSYALGRQLEFYDEPAIRKIVEGVNADDLKMQTAIREIVTSYPFRYKQARSAQTKTASQRTPDTNQTAKNTN